MLPHPFHFFPLCPRFLVDKHYRDTFESNIFHGNDHLEVVYTIYVVPFPTSFQVCKYLNCSWMISLISPKCTFITKKNETFLDFKTSTSVLYRR